MTIKILASLAIAASIFTACSESTTTPPTKAEQCAAGLSKDCLMGTWSINGPSSEDPTVPGSIIIDPSHNLSAAPATVRFYIDDKKVNRFEYTLSTATKATCDLGKTYGTWEILGTSLHLTATTNTICMPKPDDEAIIAPVIKAEAGVVTMTFGQLFFMKPEYGNSASTTELIGKSEVYTFVK